MMKEQQDLRFFLTTRFLILIVVVGVAEMILNVIYNDHIYPLLEQAYGLNELMGETSLRSTIQVVAVSFFSLLLKQIGLPMSLTGYLNALFGSPMQRDLAEHFAGRTAHMTETQKRIYILTFFLMFMLMVYFWVLPYILSAVYFAVIVSKKMTEIEEREMEKQKHFERQRNLLLSDVAHDLKTPMTTVAGYARALADEEVPPDQQKEYLEKIYGKTMQMSELLNLLFTYVKLDSEGFVLKKEKADLCELVRKVVAEQYEELEEHQIELVLDLPEEAVELSLDQVQMQRVLENLIGNACKHNPDHVTLSISLRREYSKVSLRFEDSGVEIEKSLAEHMFDPFVQGDASRSGGKGSGLGLGIVKKIVEMHDGKIFLEQRPRPGMTKAFVIELPDSVLEY